jgi:hypothetical protein
MQKRKCSFLDNSTGFNFRVISGPTVKLSNFMDLGCLSNFMRRGSRAKLSSCIRDPDKLVSITEITQ